MHVFGVWEEAGVPGGHTKKGPVGFKQFELFNCKVLSSTDCKYSKQNIIYI